MLAYRLASHPGREVLVFPERRFLEEFTDVEGRTRRFPFQIHEVSVVLVETKKANDFVQADDQDEITWQL